MGDCNEQDEWWAWFRRMGWRYIVAIASLAVFGILAARLVDEAEPLRAPLMAGFVSILVLVLAVPVQRPRVEIEWFRAAGSLGTSGAFMYIAWLSVDEEIKALVKGQDADAATAWWIILGYCLVGLIAAYVIVFLAWLVLSSGRKPKL